MSRRVPIAVLFLIALAPPALGLTACGSGGTSGPDADAIEKAIVGSATTDSPEECTELETQRFVEQIQAQKGPAAIAACKQPGDDSADAVDVSGVEVEGDKATAHAAVSGGGFDGQTLVISLLKEDGTWKLDHIDGFEDFDRDKLISAFSEGFERAGSGFTQGQVDCIAEALGKLDDGALQSLFLGGDSNQLARVAAPCLKA